MGGTVVWFAADGLRTEPQAPLLVEVAAAPSEVSDRPRSAAVGPDEQADPSEEAERPSQTASRHFIRSFSRWSPGSLMYTISPNVHKGLLYSRPLDSCHPVSPLPLFWNLEISHAACLTSHGSK